MKSPLPPVRAFRFLLTLLILSLCPVTVLLAQPVGTAASPLLANPGFEDGLTGWQANASDKGRSQASPAAARTGRFGLLVEDRSTTDGSDLFSEKIPARPGAGYELSFWGNTREGEGLGVYLVFYDDGGKRLLPPERFYRLIPAQGEGWARRVLPAIAPEKTASMAIRIHSFNQAQIVAWLDDFDLREVSAADIAPAVNRARPTWLANAEDLPAFPKPSPEKAFAGFKLLQPDGSPYRVPREDWEGARRRVTEDAAWRTWLADEKAKADAWIARHRDRAEWRAGWWHAFVDPEDGSFLEWTDAIPGEQTPTIKSRTGHDVSVTPGIMGGWVYGFRGRHIGMANTAARLWRLTGEERYADWAAAQLDFYAANYLGWSLKNGARMGGQSLEEAIWLIRLVDTARLLAGRIDEARRQSWLDNLFRPQVELLDGSFQVIHNIATWHRSAAAHVALLFSDEEMWRREIDGEFGLRAQLQRGVTSDWFWYEQSMGYNDYIVHAVHPLLVFAGLLGHRDALRDEAAIVQNLLLAPLAIRFSDNTLPNPADSTGRPRVPSIWIRDGYRVLPTAAGLAQASDVRSWDTLVDPPAAVASVARASRPLSEDRAESSADGRAEAGVWQKKPAPRGDGEAALTGKDARATSEAGETPAPQPQDDFPPVVSQRMDGSRFALLKKGPWQVFFHYGQLARSHAQAEALNWSASFDGVDVTHDPGTVGYASPLHREYFTKGLNHNVPLINGNGQEPWRPGELTVFDVDRGIMTAEQPDYRSDARARRTLRIEGERLIDEVTVALKDTDANGAALGLVLHLQGKVLLPESFAPVSSAAFAKERPAAFAHWSNVRAARFDGSAEFVMEFADGLRMQVRFATAGRFTVYQSDSPDTPRPASRAGFYIEKEERVREATFTTSLSPVR
ncbi:heparinase [Opitutaceae bacterium TAV5]|nr:heparinase [Opitutaceae bacterium TAV5]